MSYKKYSSIVLNEIKDVILNIDNKALDKAVKLICKSFKYNIVTVGAGRMGLSAKAFSMRLKHLGFNAWSLGDSSVPYTAKKDLLIVVSGSGETPSVIAIANQAKAHRQNILLFTCNKKSSLAKLAQHVVVIPTVSSLNKNNSSIQLMKTLVEQSIFILLDIITLLIIDNLKLKKDVICRNHSILE